MGFLPWPAAGNWERKGYEVHWHNGLRFFPGPPSGAGPVPGRGGGGSVGIFYSANHPGSGGEIFRRNPGGLELPERTPSACPRSLCLADCRKTDFTGPAGRETVWILAGRPVRGHAGGPLSSGGFPGGAGGTKGIRKPPPCDPGRNYRQQERSPDRER